MDILYYIVYIVFVLTLSGTVIYSIRYRRQSSPRTRGIFAARMNICMGLMFLCVSVIQMLMFSMSTIRLVFGIIVLLIGLFNLFAGIRNHAYFSKMNP